MLHGPYTVFELGDRPENLLKEIHRAELSNKGNPLPPPPPTNLAEANKKNGPPPVPPDVAEMMKKHGLPVAPPPDVAD